MGPCAMAHRFAIVMLLCLLSSSVALALMPPHVTGTNVREGVLTGSSLVIKGMTLSARKVSDALVLTDTATSKPSPWTHAMRCDWVGECESGRPGSCQESCTLTLTLKAPDGAELRVRYLDLDLRFRLKHP